MTNKTTNGYSGKIPTDVFMVFERELAGVMHGVVSVNFHIRDGQLVRYETDKRVSHIPECPAGVYDEKIN